MKLPATRHSLHLRAFEPDALVDLLAGGNLEHYLLTRTKCTVEHRRWSCGDLTLDTGHYSFPVRILGDFSEKRICVGYMRMLNASTWVNGFEADLGSIEFYPAGSELSYRAEANGQWVAIGLTETALQKAANRRFGRDLKLPHGGVISVPVPISERQILDRFVRRLMLRSTVPPLLLDGFLGFLAELLDHLQQAKFRPLLQRSLYRTQMTRRADQFLRAHVGQPYCARTLAASVGVTERTLQRNFVDAYGMTPGEWARCLALHCARKRLREANPDLLTVEGIATQCGFRHMGRFAGYYRELFDELPSAEWERR